MRLLLICFAFLFASLADAAAGTLQGQVVAVVSGDTIKVRDAKHVQYTVRLAGLDAPEKFQAHGQRAEDSLRELVFQRYVVVEGVRQGGTPRVGKVLFEGRDMNREQLQRGLAWYDPSRAQDLSPEDRQAYAAAVEAARLQRTGLWRDQHPIPPWEYRRGRRK